MIPSAASSAEVGDLCGIGGADAEPGQVPVISNPNAAMSLTRALLAKAQLIASRTAQFCMDLVSRNKCLHGQTGANAPASAGCAAPEAILTDGLCKPQPCGGACLSGNRPRPAGHQWPHHQPPSQCLYARARTGMSIPQPCPSSAAHANIAVLGVAANCLTCAGDQNSAMQGCSR